MFWQRKKEIFFTADVVGIAGKLVAAAAAYAVAAFAAAAESGQGHSFFVKIYDALFAISDAMKGVLLKAAV